VSRRGPAAAGAEGLAAALTAQGAEVILTAGDIADRDAVRTLLTTTVAAGGHRLAGIVHAAGVLDDGILESLTTDRLDAVLRPKVDAAWNLHVVAEELGLDPAAFVLFSSVTGVLGTAGQANYAAANAALDALAEHRRSRGLPAVSLAWGLWEGDAGLGGGLGRADLARMARTGVLPLSAAEGLDLLDAALTDERAVLIPARNDPTRLTAAGSALAPPLRGLVSPLRHRAASTRTPPDGPPVPAPATQRPRAAWRGSLPGSPTSRSGRTPSPRWSGTASPPCSVTRPGSRSTSTGPSPSSGSTR